MSVSTPSGNALPTVTLPCATTPRYLSDSMQASTDHPIGKSNLAGTWPASEPAGEIAAELECPYWRQRTAFRMVQLGTLFALLWKLPFFIGAARAYIELPIHQDFFNPLLSSATVVIGTYLVVCCTIAFNWLCKHDRVRAKTAWLPVIGLSVLCIHQGSYNDMTFTTAWWAMLWSAWFAGRICKEDSGLLDQGARLSRTILSVILLGGAVGKWTAEYWSGQVLYEIYFIDRDFWLYNLLRENFAAETVREIATWYSRHVIIVETVVGLTLWALPSRMAAAVAMTVYASIAIFSNYYLFSVLLSLIALAAVGFLVPKQSSSHQHQ